VIQRQPVTGYDGVNLLPENDSPETVMLSFCRNGIIIRRVTLAELVTLKRAVSDQLSAFGFAFQEFLTTRCITCRVGACGSKTARKMLMHLWLTADC